MKKGSIKTWGALLLALLMFTGCQKTPAATIVFGGDVMLARNGAALFPSGDPWGDAGDYLAKLRKTDPSALFLVNLESPLTSGTISNSAARYNLCAGNDQIRVLQQGGVSLVSLANNHHLDCGSDGIDQTIQVLDGARIKYAGNGLTPEYTDVNGIRIGVVAAEDVTVPLNPEILIPAIEEARSHCDFLVVSMHWGSEYQAGVSQRQTELAQRLADAGVDVLWGHHPHVLQKLEWLQSTDGRHRMLVMYSLGNLLSDQAMSADTRRTALVSLRIVGGKIQSVEAKPFVMDVFNRTLLSASADEVQSILDRLQFEFAK